MTTLIVTHEVDDVGHWLRSSRREDVFGPLGLTIRTFVDPTDEHRVGLILEVPDVDAFNQFMQTPEAADAMKHDGVRPDTLVNLLEA
ncbi:MAG: hypothetical protein JWP64_2420 [Pseudonocardia sp.]|jgi:hypothetical protein|uniref:hypothetical protein n=1 Tax=Pseudonocardia sp. TaxID=60912 RepID=UPI00262304DC|nr:hypothetical protein [Pseudonocardia sp.]MCU1627471.1 hypothetical protein [Pseudonocardia sp.]